MKNIEVKIGGRMSVKPRNVVVFEGDANYSHVYFKDGTKLTVATTLKMLEERFKSHNFYRSHKKYLINLNEVHSCESFQVSLSNSTNVLVSRRRRDELLTKINQVS